jgi:hypothetical protein
MARTHKARVEADKKARGITADQRRYEKNQTAKANNIRRRAVKFAAAQELLAERAKRGTYGQMVLLDKRLGLNVGAKRERSRLLGLLAKAS